MRAYDGYLLFESWLELQTAPVFQLHTFSQGLTRILEQSRYGLDTTRVKAVLDDDGPRSCIMMKVPSTPEIRRAGGLLIQAFTDQPDPVAAPPRVMQPDLFDPALDVPQGEPPARVAGLYMTERTRVMSITAYRVRLFATGDIVRAYGWGAVDHRNPGAGQELPADDLDALDTLLP